MDTTPVPPPLVNFRDLGGHPVRGGGRVRPRLLYRSTDLGGLDADGIDAIARLGIRTVYDLRTQAERTARPDRLPPGARPVAVDVLADGPADGSPAHLMAVFRDPSRAGAMLSGGGAVRMFEERYREFVELASARHAYGRLLRDIAIADRRPALVHCTTGKDRTGWAVAVLLMLLGVPDEVVMDDYLRSTAELGPSFTAELEAFTTAGGDATLLLPLLGVRPSYLETSLVAMRNRYATVEAYCAAGLGVDPTTQRAIREAFVEPPTGRRARGS